jgi:GNAT superfamily N-acetyltransferase
VKTELLSVSAFQNLRFSAFSLTSDMKPTPTQKFQVRLLKTEEIEAAVDLLGRQLSEHGVKTNLGKVRSVIERIVEDDRLGFVMLALEKDERPVGVALGCAFLGIEHGGMSGWIEELYVLPEFRQRGIGSLLIAEFIRVASGLGWRAIDLEIETGHQRAVSLYERHGFTQLDRSRLSRRLGESG